LGILNGEAEGRKKNSNRVRKEKPSKGKDGPTRGGGGKLVHCEKGQKRPQKRATIGMTGERSRAKPIWEKKTKKKIRGASRQKKIRGGNKVFPCRLG